MATLRNIMLCCLSAGLIGIAAAVPSRAIQETQDSSPQSTTSIHFITHSLGTAVYKDEFGLLRGHEGGGRRAFTVELVRAMMDEAGTVLPIDEVPLVRGFALLETAKGYAFFNVVRSADRQDRFKWVGPIYDETNYFYDHEARPTGITNLEDAKMVKGICAVRGTNVTQWFAAHGFSNIVLANSFNACLKMLNYGRVALIQSAENPLVIEDKYLAQKLHRTNVIVVDPNDKDNITGRGFIAFSRDIPDAEVARWQAALDTLKQRGDFARLRTRMLISQSDGPEGK